VAYERGHLVELKRLGLSREAVRTAYLAAAKRASSLRAAA
jgi:hypothetical protein